MGHDIPYLSINGALMYLINNTWLNKDFEVNFLARHITNPRKRCWTWIKNFFIYLNRTNFFGLSSEQIKFQVWFFGYTDAGYFSYPHNAVSQIVFCMMELPSHGSLLNRLYHSKILALYGAHTCGYTEWLTTYNNYMVLVLSNHLPLSKMIMLLVLHR